MPPFSQDEINAAKKALEKLYRAQAAELKAQGKKLEAEERKRKAYEEALRLEAERKAAAARLEAERLVKERERNILLARQGKLRARVLEPPPPPKDPPRWMPLNAATLLVPRGRLHVKVNRITGAAQFRKGAGEGGTGDSASRSRTAGGYISSFFGFATGGGGGGTHTRTSSADGSAVDGAEEGQKVLVGSAYVRFELHLGSGVVMEARTETYRNQVLGDFIPEGADVEFRLTEGVVQGESDESAPLRALTLAPPVLFYSVWQTERGRGRVGDVQLSDGQIPAGCLFQSMGGEYAEVTLPMGALGAGESTPFMRYSDGSLKAWMAASTLFTPSSAGILAVSVHEGRELAQTGVGKMDSYPSITLGAGDNAALGQGSKSIAGRARVEEVVARGAVCKEGGSSPMFNHEELLLWVDHEHCAGGSKFVLSLLAEVLGGGLTIGSVTAGVGEWTRDAASHEEVLPLTSPLTGSTTGRVLLTRQFYPAGMLTVRIVRGHNILSGDLSGGTDAYVKLTLAGRMRSYEVRTATLYQASSEPHWDETFVFDVVDHTHMRLAVWDFDVYTEDDLVGEVLVDLGGVYKHGVRDAAVPLKLPSMFGGLEGGGFLAVEADFVAPPGLAYPMLQTTVPVFSDELRENRRIAGAAEEARARKAKEAEAMMGEEARKAAAFAAEQGEEEGKGKEGGEGEGEEGGSIGTGLGMVMEDDAIEEAFRALDFNKDLFLSRLEVRHALTCLGELVTEMEVDEMVNMVDIDGDGQVAFYEFYQMCKDKGIANPLWKPKVEDNYRKWDFQAAGGVRGLTATGGVKELVVVNAAGLAKIAAANAARAEEQARKDEKRDACTGAVVHLGLRIQELGAAFRRFRRHPSFRAGDRFEGGYLTYEELQGILVDPGDPLMKEAPTHVKALFHAFRGAGEDAGRTEFLDMLLGLAAFVGCTRPQRIKFCFDLFDLDGSRSLDVGELIKILKGSHLAGTVSYLRNKALGIMKTVNCPTDGSIDLEKFVVACNRFPSVFFPSFEARDAVTGALRRPQPKSREMKGQEADLAKQQKRLDERQALRAKGGETTLPVFIPGTGGEEEGEGEGGSRGGAGGAAGGQLVPMAGGGGGAGRGK